MLNPIWRQWFRQIWPAPEKSKQTKKARRNAFNAHVEELESRLAPSVFAAPSNNLGHGYLGLDFNQSGHSVPPDSNGAAGPTSYVETVNQTIAIYTPKATGSTKVSAALDSSFFASLPTVDSTAFFSDPVVVYDDNMPGQTAVTGRFIVGDQNVDSNTNVSVFDVAVSRSANPKTLTALDWSFYQINTTENGFGADFPGNFGYNHDAFVFTYNQFGNNGPPDHVEVFSLSSTDLVNNVARAQLHVFHNDVFNDFSLRPTTMHDAPAGAPMWLLSEQGDDTDVNVYKMTNVLSNAAAFARTRMPVKPYTDIGTVPPLQPDGSALTDVIDSAIQKVSEAHNLLVADQAVSVSPTQDAAQWYVIDVSSGAPVLQQQGDVSLGNNTYAAFPSIDINALGDIGMTFMSLGTAPGQFMSMYITGRSPSDVHGTMSTPLLVPTGKGQAIYTDYTGAGRAGDISGINVDPVDGSFWAVNEFANTEATANWGTAIANFVVFDPAAADPTKSIVTVAPATITQGGAATVTLTAKNAAGTPLSQGGLTFSFGLGTGAGAGTFSNLTDNGDGTYTATFTGTVPGPVTITAVLGGHAITSAPPTITIMPALTVTSHFQVTVPASAALGTPVTVTVTALDQDNNPSGSGYTGTVHFTSTDGAASLPADATLTDGTGSFSVTFNTPGAQAVAASDSFSSGITGVSNLVIVNVVASQFVVSAPANVTAGTPFLVTVTAEDGGGNLAIGYAGVVHLTSADGQAILPPSAILTNGVGTFPATLKSVTGNPWPITATDTVNSSITGTSGAIAVAPGDAAFFTVSAPAAAVTGNVIPITVTALDAYGNIATGYAGHIHFTSTDGNANLPGDATLTAGSGVFDATLTSAGSQSVTVTDAAGATPAIAGTSGVITVRGLTVSSFTPSATGFTVIFSKAFDPTRLTLYGSGQATVPDVTLTGAAAGPIVGSVLVDPSNTSVTFKATASALASFFGAPILPDDTYTVTLVSGASNGFGDTLGAGLDGAGNGGQANYTTTFKVADVGRPILSLPDFSRGPDAAHAIQIPNSNGHGIPVTLWNAAAVTDVAFTLSYNPAFLTVTNGSGGDATDPAGSFVLVGTPTVIDATHATANFHYSGSNAQSGTVVLGDIVAAVPNSAAGDYKAKELLQLGAITVNGSPFTGISAGGVHVNAYFGDVTGNGTIDALDVATANNVAQGIDTGFAAFPLLDPAIVGDVAGDVSVDAGDVSSLAAFVSQLPTPTIPAIPSGLTITPTGADPTLSLGEPGGVSPRSLRRAEVVNIAVQLDHPHPAGSTGMSEAVLALTYDPSVFSVAASDITLGSIPSLGTGWQLTAVVDQSTGQIGIVLYSTTPIAADVAGTLVNIAFHVRPGATVPAAAVQLVSAASPDGQPFKTQVDDAEGQLVLSPGLDRLALDTGVDTPAPEVRLGGLAIRFRRHRRS